MYHKKDKDGELKCANHSFKAGKKPNGRRRREEEEKSGEQVDLTVHADDIENFCSSLEDAHDPENGTCEDCCSQVTTHFKQLFVDFGEYPIREKMCPRGPERRR